MSRNVPRGGTVFVFSIFRRPYGSFFRFFAVSRRFRQSLASAVSSSTSFRSVGGLLWVLFIESTLCQVWFLAVSRRYVNHLLNSRFRSYRISIISVYSICLRFLELLSLESSIISFLSTHSSRQYYVLEGVGLCRDIIWLAVGKSVVLVSDSP